MTEEPRVSRRGLIGAAAGALLSTSGVAGAASASAAPPLEASYISPYAPHPVISHPSSWYVSTDLTQLSIPAGVYVANQPLEPVGALSGMPDLGELPANITLLCIYHIWLAPGSDVSQAHPLNGKTMAFSSLGGGGVARSGFRMFTGAWAAAWQGELYGLLVYVWVGPEAGSEWQQVQAIVDSITLDE